VTGCVACDRPAAAIMQFTAAYVAFAAAHRCEDPRCELRGADPARMAEDRVPVCLWHWNAALVKEAEQHPRLGCVVFAWEPLPVASA